jgi:hypothetical protein
MSNQVLETVYSKPELTRFGVTKLEKVTEKGLFGAHLGN